MRSLAKRIAIASALAAVATSAPGCRKAEPEAKAEVTSTEPTRAISLRDKPAPPRAETPPFHLLKLELEAAGRPPLEALRYRPAPELAVRAEANATLREGKQTIHLTTGLALSARHGDVAIVGLAPTGDDHPSLAAYRRLLSGARATSSISSQGVITAVSGPASLEVKRELVAMLVRHLVALPAEPIGVGGRWRVKYAISRGGVFIAQTTTFELIARDGDKLTVKVATGESAEPQPILSASEVVGELLGLTSSATGTAEVDLASPIAARIDLENRSTFHARSGQDEVFRETNATVALRAKGPE